MRVVHAVQNRVSEDLDLSIFAGRRRQGKICIGGVCVVKPELEGAEITLAARF
jgi:hypothetical protein